MDEGFLTGHPRAISSMDGDSGEQHLWGSPSHLQLVPWRASSPAAFPAEEGLVSLRSSTLPGPGGFLGLPEPSRIPWEAPSLLPGIRQLDESLGYQLAAMRALALQIVKDQKCRRQTPAVASRRTRG